MDWTSSLDLFFFLGGGWVSFLFGFRCSHFFPVWVGPLSWLERMYDHWIIYTQNEETNTKAAAERERFKQMGEKW